MNLIPTWPIAAGALVVGLIVGAGADHLWMDAKLSRAEVKYDKLVSSHAEQERQRQLQRAEDERKSREKEQQWAARAGEIEQEKTNEIAQVRSAADALVDRLRKQAASKPARPSPVPGAAAACTPALGGELPDRSREDFVRLAERANVLRAGLAACYGWADEVINEAESGQQPAPAQ